MTFQYGIPLFAIYCTFILKFGPTECVTISAAEYIYPNTCSNITCNYESAIDDRTTTYTIMTANGDRIFRQSIFQFIPSNVCSPDGIVQCKDVGICWCDPDGLSTRICYNHTKGGEGQLTLRCATPDQNDVTLATIAAIPSNVFPNNMIYNVKEGSIFGPLKCTASCGPSCTFRWVGPVSIINSSELLINTAALIDNGTYQCEATNKMGSSKGHIVIIINFATQSNDIESNPGPSNNSTRYMCGTCDDVVTWEHRDGPKQVILFPNETFYPINEDSYVQDITCSADCQPDCSLMWINPTGQVESNEILSLQKIQRSQSGTYRCNASNAVSNMISTDVTIIVFYGPNKVGLSPNTTKYIKNEGEHIRNINCSSECNPVCVLNWIGPKGQILPSNELSLQNINRSQDGIYKCNATNKVSSMLSTDIEVIVNYGPSRVIISPNKTQYAIKENESLQFSTSISCTATCQPPCVGTWTIHTGEFISYVNLSFPAIKRNQTGSYRCNVSNSVSSLVSTYISVIVTYGAEIRDITIDGGNFTIPENVEKRLICKIDGVPKPYGRLFYNEEKKLSSINPIVYVVVPLCNDTGNYTCAAENSKGKANQTKELFVLCSPRPFVDLLTKIAVGNDSILEINVMFFSYPQPKISWTFSKNGSNELVRSNDTIGIYQHVSSIYITDMMTSQYGMYVLQVTNGIPDDLKHTFEVLPRRQPDIPTNFSASCDAPNYANLQWIPSFDGGDTQQFKLYYAVQDRQIVFSKHRIDIKEDEHELFNFERVDGLLPATSYVFKLIAYNTFGESSFIKAYCNTTKSGSNYSSGNYLTKSVGASIGASFFILIVAGLTVLVLKVMKRRTYIKKENSKVYQSTQPGTSSTEYDEIGRIKDEHIYQDLKKYNKDSRQQLETSPVYTNMNV